MQILERAKQIFNFAYLDRSDSEIFGMFGAHNLGDEAMKFAAIENFPPSSAIAYVRPPKSILLRKLLGNRCRKNIVVGGGTLIHGGATNWLDYVETRVNRGANLYVLGTGIAFRNSQVMKKTEPFSRWANLLRKAVFVGLRGPLSCDFAKTMGVNSQIFGDFAFSLFNNSLVCSDHKSRKRQIGCNIGECLGDQEHHEEVWRSILVSLANDYYIKLFVVTPGDIASTKRVIESSKLLPGSYDVLYFYDNPHFFMDEVKGLRLFIGLKLHAAGLAMVTGVPTLMFSYMNKSKDFVLPIGMENCLLDMSWSDNEVQSRVEQALSYPQQYVGIEAIKSMAYRQREKIKILFGT